MGSTELAQATGDAQWQDMLDAHDSAVRNEINRCSGRAIKFTGDGVLATFDGPARAIECARAIRDAVQAIGLELRFGLHAGEIETRGRDIGGIAVHIAARVEAAARPNEILVTRTVKDLVTGSTLRFIDRGEHHLKGIDEPWRLYAVERV